MQKLPVICPSCSSGLAVSQLKCPSCETAISGNYTLPVLLKLSAVEQDFIFEFFMSSGSLKKMAAQMGKSYPTVRNKLDDMIQKLADLKAQGE